MAPQDGEKSASSGVIDVTDEKAGKCSFVIALNSEGQLEISSKEVGAGVQVPEQRQDRICSGICSAEYKMKADKVPTPSGNTQRISIALIKHDPEAFDSLQVASDVSCQRKSKPGGLSRFVKVYNGEDLRSKPSFVVLEEALVRKRIEQNTEGTVSNVKQETPQSKIKPQTEESHRDPLGSSGSSHRSPNHLNTVHNRRNAGMQQLQSNRLEGEAKVASNSTLIPEATRPSTATNTHQPREHQAMGSPSHVTISFVPATPAQSVNPMMYPCQQYLNNMAVRCLSGNCCNCCPLKPPIRQAPPDHGCCNCSSCCALRSASNSCSSCIGNCCPLRPPAGAGAPAAASMQMQPSMNYCQPNLYAMPMVTQHLFAPFVPPSGEQQHLSQPQQQQQQYPMAGWYPYPPSALGHGMNQCFCQPMTTISMGSNCCRMNAAAYHHSCPHCGSFFNTPQMQQQHKTQQHQETQSVPCGNQRQRQRRFSSKRPKVPDSSDASSSPVNRAGLRRMFGPSSPQQQPQAKQDQQVKPSIARVGNGKEPTAITAKEPSRSLAGSTAVRNDVTSFCCKQSTSLYMARFGRSCMMMKPTASTSMPRLLTRRISRYTSVMAWPTNHKSELK